MIQDMERKYLAALVIQCIQSGYIYLQHQYTHIKLTGYLTWAYINRYLVEYTVITLKIFLSFVKFCC